MKYSLTDEGKLIHPEFADKKLALSTWAKNYKIPAELLTETTGKNVAEIVSEYSDRYEWKKGAKPDSAYGKKYQGLVFKKSQWSVMIGNKYTAALIANKILVKVK